MAKKLQMLPIFVLAVSLLLLLVVREQSEHIHAKHQLHTWTLSSSPRAEIIAAGPLRGIMADFRMLDVFAIYYEAKQHNQVMQYLPVYLNRAQHLDPKFFDVYRLAGSILAYDAQMPQAAIDLLRKGFVARPDVWEFPFFAGFIAHDMLHDDKQAFELMSVAAGRKGAPSFIVTLASRFLASTAAPQDAIAFLQGMLKVMPPEFHAGIKHRIQELEQGLIK